MKIRSVLCALLCCVLLAGLSPAAAAAERLTASAASGPVTLNGCAVENRTAQYPLLLYSNITYFPMTYHLCRFLGLATDWDSDTRTLSITQTGERGPRHRPYRPQRAGIRDPGGLPGEGQRRIH